MKSLKEFITENLDKLVLTTAQKAKDKSVDEDVKQDKPVADKKD
ncbi:hypothetical protein PFY12_00165 [Chryseobacterium camelliae]|uniref:Uncharacterized protein n=1 Tax=Chryseobacterium camelliae TaxID=1265445 RepID=A0ABY7QP81_9FLAO|nr:hypothetical protein [Chryseobacterium camelliae]WBV60548.1 hypothetical protein PFY12_00165 [Chryseobacterium camelliae]